ncbi:MAG: CCA tRNA nucleotidyltransferase [Victivallaceae bacterium]|nr:CCA tRNA nucleotidyltransferase [Victivallaceae bacterium]
MFLVLPQNEIFSALKKAVGRLAGKGFSARLVGGSVRDLLLGTTPSDFDLVTTAPWREILEIFPGSKLVGESFGVVLLHIDGFEFETATAREERVYLDGRHPESIKPTTDFGVDAQRRDFTINALSCDVATGEIFDYNDGIGDLKRGVVRTVGDPEKRFSEDYLRMLRAIRFASRYRFALEEKTLAAIRRLAPLAAKIAPERIRDEITAMLCSRYPDTAVAMLETSGLLQVVLPEVAILRSIEQPAQYHPEGDVLTHTLLMLSHMALPTPKLAWSVLLHDAGKAECSFRDESGRIRFFGHESAGARIAETLLTKLHFSRDEIRSVSEAIARHMHFAAVEAMKEGKLRLFVARENFPLELELNRLDCISSHHLMGAFVRLLDYLHSLPSEKLPDPLVTGNDLIALGLTPSPLFKKILDALFDEQLTRRISDRDEMLALAKRQVELHRG